MDIGLILALGATVSLVLGRLIRSRRLWRLGWLVLGTLVLYMLFGLIPDRQ